MKRLGMAIVTVLLAALPVLPALAAGVPAKPAASSTAAQRLEQRKKEQAVSLTPLQSTKLKNRCVAIQTKVRTLQQQMSLIAPARQKTYRQIDGKLWVIIGRLKLASQDTTTLETQEKLLTTKTLAFNDTMGDFRQSLDDLVVINCQTDVPGFKALLETARGYSASLLSQSSAIHDQLTNTIKPALSAAALQVQKGN